MRSAVTTIAGGLLVCILCAGISGLAMVSGLAVFGKDSVGDGCATRVTPPVGGPYHEDTEVLRAERTWFPLGAVCELDSPDDRVGPQTVRLQSWPATVVWLLAGTAAVGGAIAALRAVVLALGARWSAGGS